jgi:DNA-binding response OmpR family regulator
MSSASPIIVYAPDLMIRQKLVGEVTAAGHAARGAASEGKLAAALADGPRALIVELDGVGVDGPALVAQLRSTSPALPILGFCAHTRAELITAAREAGATLVVSRGELTRRPAEVLDRLLASPGVSG